MLGNTYPNEVCSAARALEVVGERWTLLIIRNALFTGATRFGDFQTRLGVATNVLAARLTALVAAGLMTKADDQYTLTESGTDLAPVIVALTQWGDRWQAPDGRPIIYRHRECGGEVAVATVCTCGERVDSGEIRATAGPAMPADRAAQMV